MKYPFVVDRKTQGKLVKVEAESFTNALDRVLYKHPGKRVTTTYAKNLSIKPVKVAAPATIAKTLNKPFKLILNTMDLMTAKVEAAQASRKQGKKIYINTDSEGECIVSSVAAKDPDNIMTAFVNGSEVPLTEREEQAEEVITKKEVKTKKEKTMSTVAKSKKKVASKAAPKKSAPVKKEVKGDKVPRGNNMFLTPAEWKKVDALLAKEGVTFSSWSRGLVQAKIK